MYLLDTNVISELARKSPASNVLRWFGDVREDALFLSVLSLGEIRKGIELIGESARRRQLSAWLNADLPARFGPRILPIDRRIANRWGRLAATHASRPLPVVDALLAATALEYELAVVTRNLRDIGRIGVSVIDPWI